MYQMFLNESLKTDRKLILSQSLYLLLEGLSRFQVLCHLTQYAKPTCRLSESLIYSKSKSLSKLVN